MPQQIPVYVLSLPDAADRRARLERHHARMGIELTMLDGVDGRLMSAAERAAVVGPDRPLSASEVGCHLSHAKAWRALLDSGAACAVVLEDDGLIDRKFAPLPHGELPTGIFEYLCLDVDAQNGLGRSAGDRG